MQAEEYCKASSAIGGRGNVACQVPGGNYDSCHCWWYFKLGELADSGCGKVGGGWYSNVGWETHRPMSPPMVSGNKSRNGAPRQRKSSGLKDAQGVVPGTG